MPDSFYKGLPSTRKRRVFASPRRNYGQPKLVIFRFRDDMSGIFEEKREVSLDFKENPNNQKVMNCPELLTAYDDIYHLIYLSGNVFAAIANDKNHQQIGLFIFNLESSEIIIVLLNVTEMSALCEDPASGEVRLLLCQSRDHEVFILDTCTLIKTMVYQSSDAITSVCTNSFEGKLIICIWAKTNITFIKYNAPKNIY